MFTRVKLLGVINTSITSGSFNNITTNGEYTVSNTVSNGPADVDPTFAAQLQLKVWGKSGETIQLATRTGQNIHAIRTWNGSSWLAWKVLKFD